MLSACLQIYPLDKTLHWKTQQSQAVETLESTREHAHSKVLVEPTWRNQDGNHHFGRHFGLVFEAVMLTGSEIKKAFLW